MKKDRNSRSDASRQDQSLPRSRILRGRQNFKRLFETGSVLHSPSLQFRYRLCEDPGEGVQIGFIARKKLGNAVERNRIKRRLREAYRRQQKQLAVLVTTHGVGLHGVFMAKQAGLSYQTIQADITLLVGLLEKRLTRRSNHRKRT